MKLPSRRLAGLATTGATVAALMGAAVVAAPSASAHGTYRHCTNSTSFTAANVNDYRASLPIAYVDSAENIYCYLTNGDSGPGVSALQRALNRCHSAGLVADGVFGDLTEAALRSAQRATGATVDGEYGPNTLTHIKWPAFRQSTGQFVACYRSGQLAWV